MAECRGLAPLARRHALVSTEGPAGLASPRLSGWHSRNGPRGRICTCNLPGLSETPLLIGLHAVGAPGQDCTDTERGLSPLPLLWATGAEMVLALRTREPAVKAAQLFAEFLIPMNNSHAFFDARFGRETLATFAGEFECGVFPLMCAVRHTTSWLRVAVESSRPRGAMKCGWARDDAGDRSTTELPGHMEPRIGVEPMTDNPMSSAHLKVSGHHYYIISGIILLFGGRGTGKLSLRVCWRTASRRERFLIT
jgi:hypothetical protein